MQGSSLLLLLLAVAATAATPDAEEPTRQTLYSQFAEELQMIAGALPYTNQVYDKTAENMRNVVSYTLLAKMQGLVDSVKEHAEDVWMTAEDDGNTMEVVSCVKGKDGEADEAVKRGLEAMKTCVEQVVDQGHSLARQVADITSGMEEVLKQIVTAVEDCIKSEDQASQENKTEEKKRVRKCLLTTPVKELVAKKKDAYKSLQPVLTKVFETEKQGPTCISDLYNDIERQTHTIKKNITKCVHRKLKQDL